jgi:hypothetical protein
VRRSLGDFLLIEAVVGYGCCEHEAAGIRTTVVVSLAASVATIHVNLLFHGAALTDLVRHEGLTRVALTILTGAGFLGGGRFFVAATSSSSSPRPPNTTRATATVSPVPQTIDCPFGPFRTGPAVVGGAANWRSMSGTHSIERQ